MSVRYRLRRGLLEDITKENIKEAELVYTTDTHQIFIGTDTNPKDIVAAAVEGTISPYINEAMEYALSASNNANISSINATNVANKVKEVTEASTQAITNINATETTILSDIDASKSAAITEITSNESAVLANINNAVTTSQNTAVTAVQNAQANAETSLTNLVTIATTKADEATASAAAAANSAKSINVDSLEPALGNPASDGLVLSSTTAGVRSWVSSGIKDLPSLGITSTASELNYVSGVTSSIQAQLNTKAPIESPTFTGMVTGTFNGNLTGNVSGSSGSCSGNALTATKATGIIGIDTRYNNYAPSSYIGEGSDMYLDRSYSRSEFKSVSSMGLGDYLSGTYCYVITHVPWSNISGGVPVQVAYGNGVPCYRIAIDETTWGIWSPINKGGNADTLDGNHAAYFSPISHTHTKSQIIDFPTSLPASDVYAWAKAASKPTYAASEIGLGNVTNESKTTMFASPTFTGTAKGDFIEGMQDLGSISGGLAIAVSSGSTVTATITAATQFTFNANSASGYCRVLTLILTNGGAYTITWPSSVKWSGGTAPTLSTSGIDILHFITVNNGTSWLGCLGGKGFA